MKQIRELFDSPVTYKVVNSDDEEFVVDFIVDGIPYDFQGYMNLEFAGKNGKSDHDAIADLIIPIAKQPFEIEFGIDSYKKGGEHYLKGDARYRKSDTGNASIVFSTVLQIMKEFLNVVRPKVFYFASKEENRTRLYRVFYDKISQKFPEYESLLRTWYPPEKETLFFFKRKR